MSKILTESHSFCNIILANQTLQAFCSNFVSFEIHFAPLYVGSQIVISSRSRITFEALFDVT